MVKKKVTKKEVTKKPTSKKEEKEQIVSIPPLKTSMVKITIEGMSPLMVNHFEEKSLRQISEDYINKTNKKVSTKEKKANTAEEDFEASLYKMPSSTAKKPKYGVPTAGIKKCAVTAAKRFIEGAKGTVMEGAFFVLEDESGLNEIICKKGPEPDQRMVRVGNFGNKKPALRTRAIFKEWEITFTVQYRPDIISPEMLVNLFENAGFSVGLCEYRPEKTGNLGMFRVKRSK